MIFEDACSVSIGKGLSLGQVDGQHVIFEVEGRFLFDDQFPRALSQKSEVCVVYISEGIIVRLYNQGELAQEIRGKDSAEKKLELVWIFLPSETTRK